MMKTNEKSTIQRDLDGPKRKKKKKNWRLGLQITRTFAVCRSFITSLPGILCSVLHQRAITTSSPPQL
jgi:hypothetical protein